MCTMTTLLREVQAPKDLKDMGLIEQDKYNMKLHHLKAIAQSVG